MKILIRQSKKLRNKLLLIKLVMEQSIILDNNQISGIIKTKIIKKVLPILMY